MKMVSSSRAQQAMMAMMMSFFSNRCIRMHRIHLGGACPLTSLTVEFEWLRWDSRLPWTVPPASVPWYSGTEEYMIFLTPQNFVSDTIVNAYYISGWISSVSLELNLNTARFMVMSRKWPRATIFLWFQFSFACTWYVTICSNLSRASHIIHTSP